MRVDTLCPFNMEKRDSSRVGHPFRHNPLMLFRFYRISLNSPQPSIASAAASFSIPESARKPAQGANGVGGALHGRFVGECAQGSEGRNTVCAAALALLPR